MVTILPIEIEAFKMPKPSGPTFKTSCAKTDKIATVPPKSTAIISKVNTPKISLVLNTNFTPAFKLCIMGSPIFVFKIGFFFMEKVKIRDKITNINTNNKVLSTSIQLIKKPAKSAPETEAVFQVLVLQVAALWYIFLGTNKATNENIVGPKKDRKKPPKKTSA